MNKDIDKLHKLIILHNANSKGWKIYKKNNNIFYLIKKKENKDDILELKKLIDNLYKTPINLKEVITDI